MKAIAREQDFLAWAKSKSPDDVLSHSSVDEPTIQEAVYTAFILPQFRQLHDEDNQWGLPSLKSAIAKRYGIADSQDEPRILLTPGASNAIYDVCKTFLDSDSEAVVEMPCYQPICLAVQKSGAKVVPWYRDPAANFALDLAILPNLITHRTRVVLISNPHNPTSALTTISELEQIAQIVRELADPNVIRVVVDEIYLDLTQDIGSNKSPTFAGGNLSSAARLGDDFISINSLSKVYGLSRLRCGWMLASPPVIERLRETYKVVINIGSQDTEIVASMLFQNLDEYAARSRSIAESNRERMRRELNPLLSQGILRGDVLDYGCIYFPGLPWLSNLETRDADQIIDTLDKEFGVAPGRFFGFRENDQDSRYMFHVRVGFGGNPMLFADKLSGFVGKLRSLYSTTIPRQG